MADAGVNVISESGSHACGVQMQDSSSSPGEVFLAAKLAPTGLAPAWVANVPHSQLVR